jgi:large subunit ribosomal protein L15
MLLSNLPPVKARSKKRLGRGYGSGKGGHTTNRGQKGQKSRSKVPLWFEGGQLPLVRRTPFLRGKGRFKPLKAQPLTINLDQLNSFKAGAKVNSDSVIKTLKMNSSKVTKQGLKIIATGKLDKALKVEIPTSAGAAKAIKKAGGQVVQSQE